MEECKVVLLELARTYSRIILILDALDESDEELRADLVLTFNDFVGKSEQLKILISSRRDDDIQRQLEKKANIGVEANDNQSDISKFVAEQIEQGQQRRRKKFLMIFATKLSKL